jgi:hypothetical protein
VKACTLQEIGFVMNPYSDAFSVRTKGRLNWTHELYGSRDLEVVRKLYERGVRLRVCSGERALLRHVDFCHREEARMNVQVQELSRTRDDSKVVSTYGDAVSMYR